MPIRHTSDKVKYCSKKYLYQRTLASVKQGSRKHYRPFEAPYN